jgi:hypothetical protein
MVSSHRRLESICAAVGLPETSDCLCRLGHAIRLVEKDRKYDDAADLLGSLMGEW